MFRRMRRAAFQVNAMDPAQMQSLIKANTLVSSGQSGQAAPLYAMLANEMETSAHPRRAANLHAQAAHAYVDNQEEQAALDQARHALTLFIQSKMINRIPVFYTNISRKFISKGMKSASETLAREFGVKIGPLTPQSTSTRPHHGQLPTNCTKCGAPIHKDEANWVDEETIECGFCGSLIRSE